jgi:hypothetical protein
MTSYCVIKCKFQTVADRLRHEKGLPPLYDKEDFFECGTSSRYTAKSKAKKLNAENKSPLVLYIATKLIKEQ